MPIMSSSPHMKLFSSFYLADSYPLVYFSKMASSGRKQNKKPKQSEDSSHLQAFDFNIEDVKKGLSGSEDEAREGAFYLSFILVVFHVFLIKLQTNSK